MTIVNFFDPSLLGRFHYAHLAPQFSGPFYVYDANTILQNIAFITRTLTLPQKLLIRYAVKANTNSAILKLIAKAGCGMEVVSEGELMRCLAAGIDPDRIVFSGVGKTRNDLIYALTQSIEQISVESLPELQLIASLNRPANICLRICPDIKAGDHEKITTGRLIDKFGLPLPHLKEAFEVIKAHSHLNFLGFAVHLGSQISDLKVYRQVFSVLTTVSKSLPGGLTVKRLDLGGGFSVPYQPCDLPFDWEGYRQILIEELGWFQGEVVLEPGRFLVAEAGVLFTKILYRKVSLNKTFLIVDAGMNDMMRTALYGVQHSILACKNPDSTSFETVDVVGPVCETSDSFAKDILLPCDLMPGDHLAIMTTGAYGASLASTYNSRPLIPEVLIEGEKAILIRHPITLDDFIKFETYEALK